MRLITYGYGPSVLEVADSHLADSRLGGGTIVGVFYPVRQLARFSPPNMSYILNSKIYLELVFYIYIYIYIYIEFQKLCMTLLLSFSFLLFMLYFMKYNIKNCFKISALLNKLTCLYGHICVQFSTYSFMLFKKHQSISGKQHIYAVQCLSNMH